VVGYRVSFVYACGRGPRETTRWMRDGLCRACIRNASLGRSQKPSNGDRAGVNGCTFLAEVTIVTITRTSHNSITSSWGGGTLVGRMAEWFTPSVACSRAGLWGCITAEGFRDWRGCGPCPVSQLYPGICLKTEENHE
jgi:hypothetical protein